jgi:anti-anti-sigma regulatory factor
MSLFPDVAPARAGPLTITALAREDGAGMCLRLAGDADLSECDALEQALAGPVAAHGDVHLDLTALTFADVAVARLLARTAALLVPSRKLVLHRAPPALQRLVQMCWPDQPGLEVTDA